MKNRTQLQFIHSYENLFEAHGAYFDHSQQEWFIDGEVPGPLISFIAAKPRQRDYVKEQFQKCSICNSQMHLSNSKANLEWVCSSIRCNGKRSLEAADRLNSQKKSGWQSQSSYQQNFEDRERAKRLLGRIVQHFRDIDNAKRWLNIPLVCLRPFGDTPLNAMTKIDGCAVVEALLDSIANK